MAGLTIELSDHVINAIAEAVVKKMQEWRRSEPKWIPLKWEMEGITCDIPWEFDGKWLLFTNGKYVSIERIKKDAQDHFFAGGRLFELEDATAWMPLPEPYKEE